MRALVKELSPQNPIVEEAVKQVAAETESATLNLKEMKETVQEALQEAVRERVKEMVRESLEVSQSVRSTPFPRAGGQGYSGCSGDSEASPLAAFRFSQSRNSG